MSWACVLSDGDCAVLLGTAVLHAPELGTRVSASVAAKLSKRNHASAHVQVASAAQQQAGAAQASAAGRAEAAPLSGGRPSAAGLPGSGGAAAGRAACARAWLARSARTPRAALAHVLRSWARPAAVSLQGSMHVRQPPVWSALDSQHSMR